MIGMTGFASGEGGDERVGFSVKIKSYNNRYLDLKVSLPNELSNWENDIRHLIQQRVRRGRVEVAVTFVSLEGESQGTFNQDQAIFYKKTFDALKEIFPQAQEPSLDKLVGLPHILQKDTIGSLEDWRDIFDKLFLDTLNRFERERQREGEQTKALLLSQVEIMERATEVLREFQGKNEQRLKENLKERFQEVLGEQGSECDRFYQELAASLVRFSINEEVERLEIHLKECRHLLESQEAVGKKLDFLAQELNREANTAASKALFVEITQAVVEIKDALENFREQLRNVE